MKMPEPLSLELLDHREPQGRSTLSLFSGTFGYTKIITYYIEIEIAERGYVVARSS